MNDLPGSPIDWRVAAEWDLAAGLHERARDELLRAVMAETRPIQADEQINDVLRGAAALPGTTVYDLRADVVRASALALPGYDFFLDYCHYNVRGNVLVGHLLAVRFAESLKIAASIPNAHDALRRDDERRRGRRTDLFDLDAWVGADFDVTRLVDEFEPGPMDQVYRQVLEKRIALGGDDAAAAHVFLGNQIAASPVGPDEFTNRLPQTHYEQALALDPGMGAARRNRSMVDGWLTGN
ncbi:MAG: hypothetical protein M5R36_05585 [Deltaproteobacteria bacterium]|nr:hypothetical protein [Deltaproteobacteria bacterium]